MDSSFNKEAVKEYSIQYSQKVLGQFFAERTHISGEEILELTEVKQINMFLIKLLFEAWQDEIDKIQSPYFNYESPEVADIFNKLKNSLSRNISVKREDFEPLMQQAVYDSILIIVSPYHYYEEELAKYDGNVKVEKLKSTQKFTKVNQAILNALIARLETQPHESTSDNLLNSVLEKTDLIPDEIADHVDNFNKILELDFNHIYIDSEEFVDENIEESESKGGEIDQQENEVLEEEQIIEDLEEENEDSVVQEASDSENNHQTESSDSPENESQEVKGEEDPFLTLNDSYSQGKTLADMHQKIDQIESSITLNQRFMFVNGLFDGDVDTFNNTINKLDNMHDYNEASQYISTHFDHWDKDDEDVLEFIDLVKKRFA